MMRAICVQGDGRTSISKSHALEDLTDLLRPVSVPPALARRYELFRARAQGRIALPTSIVATVVMSGLVLIDLIVVPDMWWLSLIVRLALALPIGIVACAVIARYRHSLAIVQSIYCALGIGFSSLACLLLTASTSPLAPVYCTANNLTIVFVMLILGLPPRRAAALAAAVLIIQSLALAHAAFFTPDLFLLVTGISLTMAGVGFYGNLALDRSQRLRFLANVRDEQRLRTLASQNALLERLSALDFLTGLSNRRVFDTVLESMLEEASDDETVALAMIDIDHFKPFNDTLGHQAGDAALKDVAASLDRVARAQDLVARYGGEEFAIVMPDTPAVSLAMIGARLRAAVESTAIAHPASPTAKQITVSVGIAHGTAGTSGEALVAAADRALYQAKRNGRNCVAVVACDEAADTPADDLRSA